MAKQNRNQNYYDYFEYHGNTIIEQIRKLAGITIWRDWLIFDSAEEAAEYFHDHCCA
jgi:hypothetical protein